MLEGAGIFDVAIVGVEQGEEDEKGSGCCSLMLMMLLVTERCASVFEQSVAGRAASPSQPCPIFIRVIRYHFLYVTHFNPFPPTPEAQ